MATSSLVMPCSRCSSISPTQRMTVRPASRAARTRLLHGDVGLAEVLAALAVADDDVLHAHCGEHVGGDFAGVSAGRFPVAVFSADL